jgi:hypothetical protein
MADDGISISSENINIGGRLTKNYKIKKRKTRKRYIKSKSI